MNAHHPLHYHTDGLSFLTRDLVTACLIRAGSTMHENHGQPSGQKDNTEKISLQSHEINLGRIIENYFNMATTLN